MRGGKRMGAGRKPGPLGAQHNTVRAAAREHLVELMQAGRDPLCVVLDVAFDERQPTQVRLQAATAALPFCHPKLSQQQIDARTVRVDMSGAEAVQRLTVALDRLAAPAGPVIDAAPQPVLEPAE